MRCTARINVIRVTKDIMLYLFLINFVTLIVEIIRPQESTLTNSTGEDFAATWKKTG